MPEDILWSGTEPTPEAATRRLRRRPSTRLAAACAGVAVVVGAGAFYAGRATAPSGPATLAAAVTQAQRGALPCGQGNRLVGLLCNANGAGGFGAGGRAGGNGGNGGTGRFGNGAPGNGTQGGGRFGGGFGGGLGALFGPGSVTGTVSAVHGGTVTVQTRGGSVDFALPAGVTVTRTTSGASTDVVPGVTVVISSTTDANGHRSAQRVFVLPASGPN